jgi:hypothetical protein
MSNRTMPDAGHRSPCRGGAQKDRQPASNAALAAGALHPKKILYNRTIF